MTAAATYDTAQDASTPASGKYANLETKVEQLGAAINDHATSIDTFTASVGGTLTADADGRAKMGAGFFDTTATVDAKFAANVIGEDLLTAAELTGRVVANVANANIVGAIPVVHVFEIADAATADYDIVCTHRTEFYAFTLIKTGAAGVAVTCTMKNGATAITDAMDLAVADKVVVRPLTIDDASNVVAAAGTLRASIVRTTSGAGVKIIAYGFRRA